MAKVFNFSEIGITGLNRQAGYVNEEFLPALRGHQAIKVYKEMSSNDPVIGAIFFAAEQLCRKASWRVEEQGTADVDKQAAEFLTSCMNDMNSTWADTIAEILSMLTYGWSWHEIVYKKREGGADSQYNDGRIGWKRLPGRSQDTLFRWEFSENGSIQAMVQLAPPDYKPRTIPIDRSLLFRTKADKNNPEGRSMLRNAYRPWYFKKHIEEIEGIGIERDLAGLPLLQPPDGVDIWNTADPNSLAMKARAESIVRNIRRDENEGMVLPFGWTLTLLSTGSRRQFDTNEILNRYDHRIAITVLADMVMLGGDKVGSYALADIKKGLFAAAIESWLDSIAEVFNRHAVPRLFALNVFPGLEKLPKLVHGEIEAPSLDILGGFITAITGAGVELFPDLKTENYVRELASLPTITEEEFKKRQEEAEKRKQEMQKQFQQKPDKGNNGDGNTDNGGDNGGKTKE